MGPNRPRGSLRTQCNRWAPVSVRNKWNLAGAANETVSMSRALYRPMPHVNSAVGSTCSRTFVWAWGLWVLVRGKLRSAYHGDRQSLVRNRVSQTFGK